MTHAVFVDPSGDPSIDGLVGDVDFLRAVNHDHTGPGESGSESQGGDFTTGRSQVGPIDLTSFQGLTGTHTVAIRSYASDGLDRDFGVDSIVLHGNVTAVPEPSWLAVLLGVCATDWMRRGKRSRQRDDAAAGQNNSGNGVPFS